MREVKRERGKGERGRNKKIKYRGKTREGGRKRKTERVTREGERERGKK